MLGLGQACAAARPAGPGLAAGPAAQAQGAAGPAPRGPRRQAGPPPPAGRTRGAATTGARPGRRVAAAASLQEGSTATLPLNYYKLLGVSGVCSRDTLARALEK